MCIELILLAVNINFVSFSTHMTDAVGSNPMAGQVFALFILTVAAAEAAVAGLPQAQAADVDEIIEEAEAAEAAAEEAAADSSRQFPHKCIKIAARGPHEARRDLRSPPIDLPHRAPSNHASNARASPISSQM